MGQENYVILLLDESAAMASVMQDKLADGSLSTKTNAERIATGVNNLLRHLLEGPQCDVAIVGYRTDEQGQVDVSSRWPNAAAGDDFLSTVDLNSIATIEKRTKKVPGPNGMLDEISVDFPVWYVPRSGEKAPQIAAFKYVAELIRTYAANNAGGDLGQPILIHIFSGTSGDGNPQMAIQEVLGLDAGGCKPLVVQCHIAASSAVVTSALPSKQAFLTAGLARDLFSRASELPAHMRDALQALRANVQDGARAVFHNAKMTDLFRCLELAKCHVANNGSVTSSGASDSTNSTGNDTESGLQTGSEDGSENAESEFPNTASTDSDADGQQATGISKAHDGEGVGLAVLILDRSVTDPYSGDLGNSCNRLQDAANEILKTLSTKQCLGIAVDAAIISYGLGSDGQPDIRRTFEGPLAGKSIVRNSDLPDNAIRVEESVTEIPNGAGGLITVKKKTPVYFDVEPTAASSPEPAFTAAAEVIGEWYAEHPTGFPPIVLHLTRGEASPSDTAAAAESLKRGSASTGPVVLHHHILTEGPSKSAMFPSSDSDCEGDSLKALWNSSSRVVGSESLSAAKRPYIEPASKGFVVNGKFDILADEFVNALSRE